MAPKQRVVVHASSSRQQRGFLSSAWNEITSPDNTTVVRSVLVFGAAVAFLHSSLSEFLLPP
ncbi:putative TOM core complex subunit Tom6 [Paecilomyces variotii]|uniref:Putative TOM core complex subunit Tom6 n=1 Tax=Byssochlamys spectabilis TaxID=264951 RepID=A0A443HMK9_BYSSP|nr:putative TOM core complex subunit Tom6 [Paecilomyces variotii]RWQ93044.1 putative TOM core complex subunit Tom6 [Paecilomyces variotii]